MTSLSPCDRRLALMQLSDSFFPSGLFTLSHGLESLVQSGQVRSRQDLVTYLRLLLHQRVASSDLVALNVAHHHSHMDHWDQVRAVDHTLYAYTLLQSARTAQQKSGQALAMVAHSTWPDAQLDVLQADIAHQRMPGLHAVVFAVVARAAGLDAESAAFAYLHSWLTGLVGAALRLGLIGHLQGQQIIQTLAPEIEQAIHQSRDRTLDDLWAWTPTLDIAQMGHRHLSQRLFSN
jgi:urease accessory protein